MARVQLLVEELRSSEPDRWKAVVQAVEKVFQSPIQNGIPEPAIYVDAVMAVHGAMCNGGWCSAIVDHAINIDRSVKGFEYFGLTVHASLVAEALQLLKERDDDLELDLDEAAREQLESVDTRYYGLPEPQRTIDAYIRTHPEQFAFDVEV